MFWITIAENKNEPIARDPIIFLNMNLSGVFARRLVSILPIYLWFHSTTNSNIFAMGFYDYWGSTILGILGILGFWDS